MFNNFGNLPLEMQNEVAMQLPFPDLVRLCSTNPDYRAFCTSTLIWKRVFSDADLPIFQPQTTFQGWVEEYRRSSEAMGKVDYLLEHLNDILPKNEEANIYVLFDDLDTDEKSMSLLPQWANREAMRVSKEYGRKATDESGLPISQLIINPERRTASYQIVIDGSSSGEDLIGAGWTGLIANGEIHPDMFELDIDLGSTDEEKESEIDELLFYSYYLGLPLVNISGEKINTIDQMVQILQRIAAANSPRRF